MSDEPLELRDVAATTIVNRKVLVMLASLLVGSGVLTLDELQDCLTELAKEERDGSEMGQAVAAQLDELAKLLDPSLIPLRPAPDPVPSRPRSRRRRR